MLKLAKSVVQRMGGDVAAQNVVVNSSAASSSASLSVPAFIAVTLQLGVVMLAMYLFQIEANSGFLRYLRVFKWKRVLVFQRVAWIRKSLCGDIHDTPLVWRTLGCRKTCRIIARRKIRANIDCIREFELEIRTDLQKFFLAEMMF